MNHKALQAGLVVAAISFVLLFFYLRRDDAEASVTIDVLVVRQDLASGEPVRAEALVIRQLPTAAYIEDRHVRASDRERILGIRTTQGVQANQALLWTDLATRADLLRFVRRGMRAVTIQQDSHDAVVTLLHPGDRVDLFFSATRPATEEDGEPIRLLQNVLILAVDADTGGEVIDQGAEHMSDVSMSVTIDQAAILTDALSSGKISLTRRDMGCGLVEDLEDITDAQLIEPAAR